MSAENVVSLYNHPIYHQAAPLSRASESIPAAHDTSLDDEPLGIPPHNIQAEQAVLCGILQKSGLIHQAASLLKPEHFYHTAHEFIFGACLELVRSQTVLDVISVRETLNDQGTLDAVGGAGYILDLASHLPEGVMLTPESFRYWAELVLDNAQRRELMTLGHGLVEIAQDRATKDYMPKAQAELMAIEAAFAPPDDTQTTATMADRALEIIETRINNPGSLTGISTGIRRLDEMTNGFQAGQLISLGARPGGGKTALALNLAAHVAITEQRPILFFSMEMGGDELMARQLHAMSESTSSPSMLRDARARLKPHERRFIIEDRPEMSLTAIQARIQKERARHADLGLVVIDHLALIASEADAHKRWGNRAYELGHMTRTLKRLAKSLQLPILLLCQLNREIETRQSKKPQLSDLRDSGSIEMDSDLVLFTHIDRDENRQPTGTASLHIAKQRNGALGEIPLLFIPHLTRFKENRKF